MELYGPLAGGHSRQEMTWLKFFKFGLSPDVILELQYLKLQFLRFSIWDRCHIFKKYLNSKLEIKKKAKYSGQMLRFFVTGSMLSLVVFLITTKFVSR